MARVDKSNEAWKELLNKYQIVEKIKNEGYYEIKSSQIKEFREPRLMAKWDSFESLPSVLKKNNINILPNSRSSYILSDFKLYENIDEKFNNKTKMKKVSIPSLESIDIKNITTESNAINVLLLSDILDDFLEEEDNVSTFNGRMGTGKFEFQVDRMKRDPISVEVDRAQCEIDGGLENHNSVVIIEAKNVVNKDFHVRQLYYPYRLWSSRVNKPIRLVFSVYSNQIFRLLEYKFNDINNYSSIELVNEKFYTLDDAEISLKDLLNTYKNTKVKTDDNISDNNDIPFVQADSFEKVISLMEALDKDDLTKFEIAEIMDFNVRQSDYYYNAGRYLGLFDTYKDFEDIDEDGKFPDKRRLTKLGNKVMKKNYKDRQLSLVSLMLEHKIFNELFFEAYSTNKLPDKITIQKKMIKYNVCGTSDSTITRRSSTVSSWLDWIFKLTRVEEV